MLIKKLVYIFIILFFSACGLYKAPVPPEFFAAKKIENFVIKSSGEGLILSWKAPSLDQKKNELKYIDGYKILRKGPVSELKELKQEKFVLNKFVEDKHLIIQRQMKDQAIKDGKLSRKVKVDDKLKSFEYADDNLERQNYYSYIIIPINQGGVEGETSDLVQVFFDGVKSKIFYIDNEETMEETSFEEEATEELEVDF